MAELPIEKVLRILSTKIDFEKLDDTDSKLSIYFTDLDSGYTLHFRNGILAVNDEFDDLAFHSITLDSESYKMIVIGHLSLIDGINSGEIKFDGEVSAIEEMLDYFDPFSINT